MMYFLDCISSQDLQSLCVKNCKLKQFIARVTCTVIAALFTRFHDRFRIKIDNLCLILFLNINYVMY